MTQSYSRPLSSEAKEKLREFIEAYFEILIAAEVDEKAEIAKAKAIELLQTDIDIVLFGAVILIILGENSAIAYKVQARSMTVQDAAQLLVDIVVHAREEDIRKHPE